MIVTQETWNTKKYLNDVSEEQVETNTSDADVCDNTREHSHPLFSPTLIFSFMSQGSFDKLSLSRTTTYVARLPLLDWLGQQIEVHIG